MKINISPLVEDSAIEWVKVSKILNGILNIEAPDDDEKIKDINSLKGLKRFILKNKEIFISHLLKLGYDIKNDSIDDKIIENIILYINSNLGSNITEGLKLIYKQEIDEQKTRISTNLIEKTVSINVQRRYDEILDSGDNKSIFTFLQNKYKNGDLSIKSYKSFLLFINKTGVEINKSKLIEIINDSDTDKLIEIITYSDTDNLSRIINNSDTDKLIEIITYSDTSNLSRIINNSDTGKLIEIINNSDTGNLSRIINYSNIGKLIEIINNSYIDKLIEIINNSNIGKLIEIITYSDIRKLIEIITNSDTGNLSRIINSSDTGKLIEIITYSDTDKLIEIINHYYKVDIIKYLDTILEKGRMPWYIKKARSITIW